MSQIVKKFIGDNEVGAAKIRLETDSFLRTRNNANSADLEVLKTKANDETLLKSPSWDLDHHLNNWWVGDVSGIIKTQGSGTIPDVGIITKEHANNSTTNGAEIVIATGEKPGASSTGRTGGVSFVTGWNEGSGNSGQLYLESGYVDSGTSGDIGAYTGDSATGSTGQLYLESGDVSGGAGNSGRVLLKTGSATGSSGRSGNIELFISAGGTAGQGNIIMTANGMQLPNQTTAPTLNLQDGLMYYNPTLSDKHPYVYDITAAAWKKIILAGDPELGAGATWEREEITLVAGDITNGYVDLANEIINDSLIVTIYTTSSNGGLVSRHGVDYTLSVVGLVTRLTFSAHTPALVAGDIIVAQYQYE